jgi:nicotinamidase-related amidase
LLDQLPETPRCPTQLPSNGSELEPGGVPMTDLYTRPQFSNAALLSIDVQRDVLNGGPLEFASPEGLLPNMARVVEAFRAANRPIVHVVRLYLANGRNADLCRRGMLERGRGALVVGTPGSALVTDLLPDGDVDLDANVLLNGRFQYLSSNEAAMYKPRWGAFFRTQLLAHLWIRNVTTVVVIGCNFPNCPRATVVEASERDLRVVAVADALSRFCHRDSMDMHDMGVAVMTSVDVAENLGRSPAHATATTR